MEDKLKKQIEEVGEILNLYTESFKDFALNNLNEFLRKITKSMELPNDIRHGEVLSNVEPETKYSTRTHVKAVDEPVQVDVTDGEGCTFSFDVPPNATSVSVRLKAAKSIYSEEDFVEGEKSKQTLGADYDVDKTEEDEKQKVKSKYINDVVNMYAGWGERNSGRTTRMIDRCIQNLFEKGETAAVDHTNTTRGNEYLKQRIKDRILREHGIELREDLNMLFIP